jgi:uncharacterized membrane protein
MSSIPASSKPIVTTDRLEAFSDGVFAIAITLLIFGIKVPIVTGTDIGAELKRQLLALWPSYLSFGVSFAIISIFWIGHHHMIRLISRPNRTLLWLNNLFLMCVSFIPFPAALISMYGGEQIGMVLYCGTIIITGIALYSLWAYASSGGRLLYSGISQRVIKVAGWRILGGTFFYGVALTLSFVNLTASRILLVLIPLFYLLPSSIDPHIEG